MAESQHPEQDSFVLAKEDTSFLGVFGIKTRASKVILAGTIGLVLLCSTVSYLLIPPLKFPTNTEIIIEKGTSLGEASLMLKESHAIRSRLVFEFCVMTINGNRGVQAGTYLFKESLSPCTLALRLARGVTGVPAVRLTIPEGSSVAEIGAIVQKTFPKLKSDTVTTLAKDKEGYLFPETYFFFPEATEEEVLKTMEEEFQDVAKSLASDIEKSGHTMREIVIMASILEKEARTPEDQALVSGILWKRISMKMPLQVDAPFLYILGKTSAQLTQADLKMKSGYNTYVNRGLPVGPIGNPGLSALKAAIHPTKSNYLYYLSDNDGGMHYAKTFEEHKANKLKYLR